MSPESVSRRTVLRTMMMGAAGAAASACGGGNPPPSAPAATPKPAPAPAADPSRPVASTSEPAVAAAGPLPLLSPSDPAAVALKYTTDASQVAAMASPTFVQGQACSNCIQYQGAPGDSHGPCAIFPGKAVAAAGWCSVYARKP
jgi:hypothetical protein